LSAQATDVTEEHVDVLKEVIDSIEVEVPGRTEREKIAEDIPASVGINESAAMEMETGAKPASEIPGKYKMESNLFTCLHANLFSLLHL